MHPCEENKDGCRELLTLPRTPLPGVNPISLIRADINATWSSSLRLSQILPLPVACLISILVRVLIPVGLHGELHSENSVHWLGTQSPRAVKETFQTMLISNKLQHLRTARINTFFFKMAAVLQENAWSNWNGLRMWAKPLMLTPLLGL